MSYCALLLKAPPSYVWTWANSAEFGTPLAWEGSKHHNDARKGTRVASRNNCLELLVQQGWPIGQHLSDAGSASTPSWAGGIGITMQVFKNTNCRHAGQVLLLQLGMWCLQLAKCDPVQVCLLFALYTNGLRPHKPVGLKTGTSARC